MTKPSVNEKLAAANSTKISRLFCREEPLIICWNRILEEKKIKESIKQIISHDDSD